MFALRAIEAFNTGDREGFRDLFADDGNSIPFTAESNFDASPDQAWESFWSYLDSGWHGLRIEHAETHVQADSISIIGRFHATLVDDDETVASPATFIFGFAGGKITEFQIRLAAVAA